jgi:hypothetical protein
MPAPSTLRAGADDDAAGAQAPAGQERGLLPRPAAAGRCREEQHPMIVPWLVPVVALAAIVAFVVLLANRRKRGRLPAHPHHGATSTRP